MKKSRMLQSVSAVVLALGIIVGGASFSSAATYTAYVLQPLNVNNYTSYHSKTTALQYIQNKVTAFTNTSSANFWAQTDGSFGAVTISQKYLQRVSSNYTTINFNTNLSVGNNVRLAMENATTQSTNAFVSGDVIFH